MTPAPLLTPLPAPSRPSATTSATCPGHGPVGDIDHREALRWALARIEAGVTRRAEACARIAARLAPAAPEVC